MDDLRAAPVSELQEFFNTYYLPNNAVLVIAGDIDVDAATGDGEEVFRVDPPRPRGHGGSRRRSRSRRKRATATVDYRVPLPAVMVGYHLPPYRSDDQYALSILATILGDGRSSRLDRLLVNTDNPQCRRASPPITCRWKTAASSASMPRHAGQGPRRAWRRCSSRPWPTCSRRA